MTDPLSLLQQALSDRYLFERELGRGGMSRVYLARDRRYEREVAVKVLDPEIATAVGAERFLREIRITAQLQHPHIVPLLESGEAAGLLYSVMPYIEGESLRDRLMARGRLAAAEAVSIACGVADALDYAHRRGVIHRDIKPENILISNGLPVVADFGIARAVGLAGGATLTGVGFPIGTAAYMSPEQATAASPVDGRSDIYSLGCVLYEMLSGRMAFTGPTLKSVLTQQLTTDPPLVPLTQPDVTPELVAVVRRSLAKQPGDRYPTAGELAEALRGLLSSLPRLSTPVPVVPAETSGGPGRWLVPLALVVVAGALVLALIRGRAERDPAGPRGDSPYAASVAVLPFDNLNGDATDEYFSEGITDEIIGQLAQVESLKVISRTSVMALKGTALTLPQIAETLGVRHIVEGAVRRQGDRVRVTAELIEAATDAHLWAASFEGNLADSFRVQEEIARKVSQQLLSSIRGLRPMASAAMPARSAAFDATLRGRSLLERHDPVALDSAVAVFGEAVKADSEYAPAWSGLATAYSNYVVYGFAGRVELYQALADGRRAAERAVALAPDLAEGHHALADIGALGLGPESDILNELRTAQRLMPSSADVRMAMAHTLGRNHRWDQALEESQRALALDPLSTGLRHSAIALALGARRYDLAADEARRARALVPGDIVAQELLAYALLLSGKARACLGSGLELWDATRAMCLQAAGQSRQAAAAADSAEAALSRGQARTVYQYTDLAAYYARRGDVSRSLAWLQRMAAVTPVVSYWYLDSGLFDRVRSAPAFQRGLDRLESEIRARVAGTGQPADSAR
ncbi:MAG TPA: protein kinase [Gemmatimonadales bacterium]|nr:protein kinase [Gemmatimonadales bacterium]